MSSVKPPRAPLAGRVRRLAEQWSAFQQTSITTAFVFLAAALILAGAAFMVSEPVGRFGDFRDAYYPAGVAAFDPPVLEALIRKGVFGFVNIPILAWLFAPFALLPWRWAAAGPFLLIGVLSTGLAYVLLVRAADVRGMRRGWLLLLFAINGPLVYSIKIGNTAHVVLALLAGGLCLVQARRSFAAGALLGAAALIKLPLLLFGLFFLARRDWKGVAGFGGTVAVTVALSVAVFGLALHLVWFDVAVRQFSQYGLAAFNVQSVQGALMRLREPTPPLFDWTTYALTGSERTIVAILTLSIYGIAFLGWLALGLRSTAHDVKEKPGKVETQYALVLCLALVSSPLTWSHYYCWLLLPTALFLGGRFATGSSIGLRLACLGAIVLTTPLVSVPQLRHPDLAGAYALVTTSVYLIGGLLWLIALTWSCFSFLRRDEVAASGDVALGLLRTGREPSHH